MLADWIVERIVHFGPGDLVKNGQSHFGFHDMDGNHYAIFHQKHFLGLIGKRGQLEWTCGPSQVLQGISNIKADLKFPMYIDNFDDESLVVSNFGDARLYRINAREQTAELFVDGHVIGMKDAGNCVVDNEDTVWVNEVKGCKIWRFDNKGKPMLTLGDGKPGFQTETTDFDGARFSWIYDIRRGPDGNIYVLDSKNFAVRMINPKHHIVTTIAGTGKAGYGGDDGDARSATFGNDPSARFDGPISLSLDEEGNIFVGDRMNHVVRMIHKKSGTITTIAGSHNGIKGMSNSLEEKDPLKLNLPEISSMDYFNGQLLVPTDLAPGTGDLAMLIRQTSPR